MEVGSQPASSTTPKIRLLVNYNKCYTGLSKILQEIYFTLQWTHTIWLCISWNQLSRQRIRISSKIYMHLVHSPGSDLRPPKYHLVILPTGQSWYFVQVGVTFSFFSKQKNNCSYARLFQLAKGGYSWPRVAYRTRVAKTTSELC